MSLKLRILGCGGNIGFKNQSTCFMCYHGDFSKDTDIVLIDGGTGITRIQPEQIPQIKEILLTHAHLDHTCGMALLVESFFDEEMKQVCKPTLHCSQVVYDQLTDSVCKKGIWMDLVERGFMNFKAIEDTESTELVNGMKVTAVKSLHGVMTLGFIVEYKNSAFAFTGDTTYYEPFWKRLSQVPNLKGVICEVSLRNEEEKRATESNHMTPNFLQKGIKFLDTSVTVYATHIKSYCYTSVLRQLKELDREIVILNDEMVLEF